MGKRVNQPSEGSGTGGKAGQARPWPRWLDPLSAGWPRVLLVAFPVALGLRIAGAGEEWQFAASALAIVPLASLMGEATEVLALRLGPGIGGLLNATLGNAAEMIIALFALFRGLDGVVKASITGSIIGNLLLVLGASLFAGGLRYRVQYFNKMAAGVGGTLAVLAAVGLLVPAIFHRVVSSESPGLAVQSEHRLSMVVSLMLIATYGLNLLFSLVTHRDLFSPGADAETAVVESATPAAGRSVRRALRVLALSAAGIAIMSEVLAGAAQQASRALGLTEMFVGVVVVALVGNAAEHSTAVAMAWKNQADLAVGIAIGSALQIALFVAPVLVLVSHLRPQPMDLLFRPLEVVSVILAVLIARMVAEDGESNWLEGAMLLVIYVLLAAAFFFLPEPRVKAPDNGGGWRIIAPVSHEELLTGAPAVRSGPTTAHPRLRWVAT